MRFPQHPISRFRLHKITLFGLGILLLVSFSCRNKQAVPDTPTFPQTDFQSREIEIDSKKIRYRVFIPKNRNEEEKLPVMLYLHGSDERGDDNESQLSGPAPSILAYPDNFRFAIVFPQTPVGRFWDKDMLRLALAELDQTVKELNGDQSRLYLAGFSLGGYGVWATAALYPDKFAAVVPMSGRLLPRPGERKNFPAEILELTDADDPFAAFANKLSRMPIWIFHGANDNIVPVENSRRMAKALKDAGNSKARYTELENTGHVSLTAAFSNPELFRWLSEQRLQ